jgi:hypothetical protein
MLIRPSRGRFLFGIDSHVFLPMMTAFCLLESFVRLVTCEKCAISFLMNKIIGNVNCIEIVRQKNVLECFMKQDYKLQLYYSSSHQESRRMNIYKR